VFRLESDVVVDGVAEPLLAAEITLSRQHADMPEQELDLLEFAARRGQFDSEAWRCTLKQCPLDAQVDVEETNRLGREGHPSGSGQLDKINRPR
jgi:hypothetical protein